MTRKIYEKDEMHSLSLKNKLNEKIRNSEIDDSDLEEEILKLAYSYCFDFWRSVQAKSACAGAYYVLNKEKTQNDAAEVFDTTSHTVKKHAKNICRFYDYEYSDIKPKPFDCEETVWDIKKDIADLADIKERNIKRNLRFSKSAYTKIRKKLQEVD